MSCHIALFTTSHLHDIWMAGIGTCFAPGDLELAALIGVRYLD